MAGTLKKAEKMLLEEPVVRVMEPVWKAGIYARLSVDSDPRKNESIDIQIEIAKEFINRADDIELVDCYSDLGKTGTDFKRDGFESMMSDIRRKKINCVIVKDFSRFGRNYIETGNYIEKIFPFMKVRFIAVTDDYDSEHITGDGARLSMNLKNIVNELYAKDIAQRVKTARKQKQETGSYTGGIPPYGYLVEKVGERKVLFPDMATKDIVVRIFEKYAQGDSRKDIIEELYKKRVQRPVVYQETKKVYCPEGEALEQWSDGTIKWILVNPVYIGTLFQATICGREYQGHRRHEIGKEDVTVIEHAHEPIVSEELFYKVAQRFEKQSKYSNRYGFSKKVPQDEDILKGRLYCGGCGHRLVRKTKVKTFSNGDKMYSYYYVCPNRYKIDESVCECQGMTLKALEEILKSTLEKEFAISGMRPKAYCKENMKEAQKRKDVIQKKKKEMIRRQDELALAGSKFYLRYREGDFSREEFLERKNGAEEELELLRRQEEDFTRQEELIDKKTEEINKFIRRLIRYKGNYKFDREIINCLIEKMNIYPDRRVEIIWSYRKEDLF